MPVNKIRIVCLTKDRRSFDDLNGPSRGYKAHQCDLAFAVTYHKVQGETKESIILSLNSIKGISKKIHPISLPSLYVGCSRVHNHDQLRALPFSTEVRNYLKKLQWDPQLRLFFQNYDKDGRWIPDGLKNLKMQRDKTTKLELGMTELTQYTVEEIRNFCKRLNQIVSANEPRQSDYIQALTEAHVEGQRMLNADNGRLFRDQQLKIFVQLQKKDVNKMKLTELRHYGKRLGVTTAKTMEQIS